MRIAIYTRVSTEEQAREGTSLQSQMERLTNWANLYEHTIAGKYVDDGYSGKDDVRPNFQLMMIDAKAKKFDLVVTTKLDRFFRNLKKLLEYEEELRKLDVSYNAIEESIDTSTPHGRLIFQVLGIVAEWERARIAERMQTGREQHWRAGKAASGKVLYGYIWDKDNSKWLINEEEAKVVKAIYRLYVDQEMGMAKIAERLNQDGIPTSGWGKKGWTDQRIGWILHHPAYAGEQHMNRKEPRDFMSGNIDFDMPAIIDKQTQQIAQRRIEGQKHVGRNDGNQLWLLQALIKCGECGYGYRCQTYVSGRRVYTCLGRRKIKHLDGSARCTAPSIGADTIENLVWDKVKACLEDSELLRQSILNSLDKAEQRKQELSVLCQPVDEKIAKLRERMHRKGVRFEMEQSSEAEYRQQMTELRKEEAELSMRRNGIDPEKMAELETLEGYVDWAKEFWAKAELKVKEDYIAGYDRESIGQEGMIHGLNQGVINLATGLTEILASDKMTKRAMLERFNISIWIKENEAEIRGLIPTQSINILPQNSVSRIR